jgi:hypothetical protein
VVDEFFTFQKTGLSVEEYFGLQSVDDRNHYAMIYDVICIKYPPLDSLYLIVG